jgi:hypothetical protein
MVAGKPRSRSFPDGRAQTVAAIHAGSSSTRWTAAQFLCGQSAKRRLANRARTIAVGTGATDSSTVAACAAELLRHEFERRLAERATKI